MKKKLLVLIICLLILPPSAYSYYSYALDLPNSAAAEPVSFVIEAGQSVEEIAKNLEREGLIRSAALFQLYTFLSAISSKLQAGHYQIPQNLNLKQVAELLQHGKFEERLTFVEGWRREEMADEISKCKMQNAKLTKEEFLKESEGLEGYLFPDTYFVSSETTAADLVKMMRENFERKFDQPELTNLTLDEVVTIASIVEREVRLPEDKTIVAGILRKRYLQGWPLQADATVQYALGYQPDEKTWWKKHLTADDLKIESPYNTYLNPGLPPAPIGNPGLESLNAALYPTATDYWYYVSDSEGKMHFATTIDEHNENVLRYVLVR